MSPAVALSLTLWRGAKVGHVGAVVIGLIASLTLWKMALSGAPDESAWVVATWLVLFAPGVHAALLGSQLSRALHRPETKHWAQKQLGAWVATMALPWWLMVAAPASLLSQAGAGPFAWGWFSAVLMLAMTVGLSLVWTRWILITFGGLVVALTTFSGWGSLIEAAIHFFGEERGSGLLLLTLILVLVSLAIWHRVRHALTHRGPSTAPASWWSVSVQVWEVATHPSPRASQLKGLLDPPERLADHWLTLTLLGALVLAPYLTLRFVFPNFNEPIVVMLVALMPVDAFGRDLESARSPFPARGLLLPNGLRRHDLLVTTMRLQLCSPPWLGIRLTKLCLALGLAWGMQWPWPAMLSLSLAGAASVLAEFCFVAVQRHRVDPSAWRHYVVAGLLFAAMVGAINGLSNKLQLGIAHSVLLASALVSLCAVAIIATQVRRWRRFVA